MHFSGFIASPAGVHKTVGSRSWRKQIACLKLSDFAGHVVLTLICTVFCSPLLPDVTSPVILHAQSLKVMLGFQRLWPSFFSSSTFDLKKLLSSQQEVDSPPIVQQLTLQILLQAPAGSLKWHRQVGGILGNVGTLRGVFLDCVWCPINFRRVLNERAKSTRAHETRSTRDAREEPTVIVVAPRVSSESRTTRLFRSLECVWSNYNICLPENTTRSCTAFSCFHY